MGQEAASDPPREEEPSLGGGRKRALVGVTAGILVAVGVWLLIGQAASYSRLLDAIHHAAAGWFALCLVGAAGTYVGYALIYRAIVRISDGPRPSLPTVLRLTIGVFGASVLATAAGRLGVEYWSLRRMGEPAPTAWSRVLALNTIAWAALGAGAWAAALALLLGAAGGAPLAVELAWLLVLPACLVPALYVSSPKRSRLAADCGGRARRTFAAAVRGLVLLRRLARRRDAWTALGGCAIHWGGELLITWAALRAFGIALGPAALVVAYATGYASTMLPLPLGGAGGVDAATTFAMTLVGVPLGPALLATLVQRSFSYWLPLAVAIVSARSFKGLGRDLGAVAKAAAPVKRRRTVAFATGAS